MEKERLLENDETPRPTENVKVDRRQSTRSHITPFKLCAFLFLCSLCLNGALAWKLFRSRNNKPPEISEHASLTRTLAQPYYTETPFGGNPNTTLEASLWYSIDIDSGVISLPDTYTSSHSLHPAQRFPWDHTRGIYIVHGYHNLHCLKIIYIAMHEYQTGSAQSRKWKHISHCFDALRRQVLCDADDTPRAVRKGFDGVSGIGQERMCRDWGRLEEWARRNTACYKRPEPPVQGMRNIEKYSHCPEGAGYVVPDDL